MIISEKRYGMKNKPRELNLPDLKKFIPSVKIKENVHTLPMSVDQSHWLYHAEINDDGFFAPISDGLKSG